MSRPDRLDKLIDKIIKNLDETGHQEVKLSMKSLIEDDTCFKRRTDIRNRSKSPVFENDSDFSETGD